MFSQWFILLFFLHGFVNCSVFSVVPYSCLLFSMCTAYAVHILNNRHECGTTENTLQLIKPCRNSSKMNHWENMYIQIYRQNSKLIEEQQVSEINPLFKYAQPPHTLRVSTQQDP